MKILILGGTGFIGSAVTVRLAADGHEIVVLSRQRTTLPAHGVTSLAFDIGSVRNEDDWLPQLSGIDAIVNCVGTLQDAPGESALAVHATAIEMLVAACERRGLRRLVHMSAAGVDKGLSGFSQTKSRGEAAIQASKLDWIILRPSVVIGRSAYGGSALFRGLAALPVLPVIPDTGPLQLVWLDDVVETIARLVQPNAPARMVLDIVGPRRFDFTETVAMFRRWLRWPQARPMSLGRPLTIALFKLGDAASLLGWRPPVRSNALREMAQGATGDQAAWQMHTGIVPRNVEVELFREPASVQERWFSGLYVLKPLVFGIFGLFWLATGLISFGPGWDIGKAMLREGGLGETFSDVTIAAGALADIVIGLAILYRPTARYGLLAALAISFAYAIIGTILVPRLWADPLGPMLKIWPIIVLNLVALAILKDR